MLYSIIKADFLERVRGPGFLVVQGLALVLAYFVFNGKLVLQLGDYAGEYNSAWLGLQMALVAQFFFAWFGFFSVRGSVQRDYETGVGQIIATTPLNRFLYLTGKAISTFCVLLSMTAVLIVGAVLMLYLRGSATLELWDLVSPFVFFAFPIFAVTSALVVFFEVTPWLRGSFGNIVYFLGFPVLIASQDGRFFAFDIVQKYTTLAILKIDPAYIPSFQITAPIEFEDELLAGPTKTFLWEGFTWTTEIIGERMIYFGIALLVLLVAAVFFDRFDPAKARLIQKRSQKNSKPAETPMPGELSAAPGLETTPIKLSSLPRDARRTRGMSVLLKAELKLLLRGQAWWWYAGVLGGIIAGLIAPLASVRSLVLPLAWIWPLAIWSAMGSREKQHRTHQVVFSGPHPLRLLVTIWLAGFLLALLSGSGVGLRLLAAGDAGLFAWLIGALFIPSLALALGVWSNGGRAFQVVYLAFWYIGPMNQVPALDYLGATKEALTMGVPLVYLALTTGLLLLAFAGRKRDLQS